MKNHEILLLMDENPYLMSYPNDVCMGERKVKRLCLVKTKWRRNQKLENLKMIGHEILPFL
jgi:hypothetical protein